MVKRIALGVSDIDTSRAFYDASLSPIGFTRRSDDGNSSSYFSDTKLIDFVIIEDTVSDIAKPSSQTRILFSAPDQDAIDEFVTAAVNNGGLEDEPPKTRSGKYLSKYSASVIDPDGYRIAAESE